LTNHRSVSALVHGLRTGRTTGVLDELLPDRADDLAALVGRLRVTTSGGSALPVEVHRQTSFSERRGAGTAGLHRRPRPRRRDQARDGRRSGGHEIGEIAIRGGSTVYPRELEDVLPTHAGVSLCGLPVPPHRRARGHPADDRTGKILKRELT
jgi:acyl-CoA synthetase (AMP-forming)/AMP-acid ligase II